MDSPSYAVTMGSLTAAHKQDDNAAMMMMPSYGAADGTVSTAEGMGDDEMQQDPSLDFPIEELMPNTVRYGLDPQTLSKPLDTAVYGYDISQMRERPWAKPGADKSDYFNYGFDEDSWRAYCALQSQGIQSLRARADRFVAEILAQQQNGSGYNNTNAGGGHTTTYGGSAGGFSHSAGGNYGANADRDGGNRGGNMNNNNTYQPREQSKYYKTQLCQSFLNNQCTRGPACNFAHGQHELRPFVTDAPPARPNSNYNLNTTTNNNGNNNVMGGVMPPPLPNMGGGGGNNSNANPVMPPPLPIPTMGGVMPPLPSMMMGMPPPLPPMGLGMGGVMPPLAARGGDGVLSAPPAGVTAPPPVVPAAASVPTVSAVAANKGPAGFRVLPQQKREREKSPDNMTY